MVDAEEEYWVVIVDRGTGAVSSSLFTNTSSDSAADAAHYTARQWDNNVTAAFVVGKR